jgi:hypothetical protein
MQIRYYLNKKTFRLFILVRIRRHVLMVYVYYESLILIKSIARALDLTLLYFNKASGRLIAWFSRNGRVTCMQCDFV